MRLDRVRPPRVRRMIMLLSSLALAACDLASTADPPQHRPRPVSWTADPASITVGVGGTVTLALTVLDAGGERMSSSTAGGWGIHLAQGGWVGVEVEALDGPYVEVEAVDGHYGNNPQRFRVTGVAPGSGELEFLIEHDRGCVDPPECIERRTVELLDRKGVPFVVE